MWEQNMSFTDGSQTIQAPDRNKSDKALCILFYSKNVVYIQLYCSFLAGPIVPYYVM